MLDKIRRVSRRKHMIESGWKMLSTVASPATLLPASALSTDRRHLNDLKLPNSNFSRQITHHLKSGQLREAITALDFATRDGSCFPDLLTYSLLLKNCIRSRCFRLGELVHESFSRSGLTPDTVFLNSLISLYAKAGKSEMAKRIFDSMGSRRDLVSWSAVMSCFVINEMEADAIRAFVSMLGAGFVPNEYCYTSIIKACSNKEFFPIGEAILGSVLKTCHLDSDVCVGCALIDMLVQGGGDVEAALKVFDKMPEKNVVAWTLMITRLQQTDYCDKAAKLFLNMVSSGSVPDEFTLSGVISAAAELGCLRFGIQLHTLAVKLGFAFDVCVGCSLIDMYAKCSPEGSMDSASKIFNHLPAHNVMSWTAIITGYTQNGISWEAIEFFLKMMKGHIEPNHFTFSSVIKACADVSFSLGQQTFAYSTKLGLSSSSFVGNSLISLYARAGDTDSARKLFDWLVERNVVSYNTLIDAYSKNSKFEQAFELVHEVEGEDAFTSASLLIGASSIGSVSKGEQIHARVIKSELTRNLHVSNSLISMYSRCGDVAAAFRVFNGMVDRNVISWTAMVTAFAKHGLAVKALETFQSMVDAGVAPNEVTYVAVLTACSHVGLISEGWKHFEHMNEHGILPRMEHYACMVDLLSRSGRLAEAKEFITSMPMKADVLVLKTFLGACQVRGNVEFGRIAAEMILEQDPDDPAAYVLLSNLCAAAGQWDDVAEIRKRMKERKVAKLAGCSWLESGNEVHKFFVGDTAHPRAREIYDELERLAVEVKDLGYVPDTNFVLHDVEDEQKEQYLLQHSEKIAVAYGLISIPGSKPIRVFKNLRVCGDCHSAMKYFSIARGREIVVRDATRFHHFRDGKCSCNDYW